MIADGIEEDLHLDYKGAGSLAKTDKNRAEIVKDVTAFANSDGGVIIYGVREHSANDKKHLPSEIDPVSRTEFSKEWLEQVISTAAPRISNIIVHPVPLAEDASKCIYVVEIPKGDTAHQSRDHCYYRRYNFESVAMKDHEIRDVMNRIKTPKLEIEVFFGIREPWEESNIVIRARNSSRVIARRFSFALKMPLQVGDRLISGIEEATLDQDGDGGYYLAFSIGQDIRAVPLFPHETRSFSRVIRSDVNQWVCAKTKRPLVSAQQLKISVFADEMTPFIANFDPAACRRDWQQPSSIEPYNLEGY